MKLLIRNLTVTDADETLLDNASYTFYQENVYCINAAKKYKNALFNSTFLRGTVISGIPYSAGVC